MPAELNKGWKSLTPKVGAATLAQEDIGATATGPCTPWPAPLHRMPAGLCI